MNFGLQATSSELRTSVMEELSYILLYILISTYEVNPEIKNYERRVKLYNFKVHIYFSSLTLNFRVNKNLFQVKGNLRKINDLPFRASFIPNYFSLLETYSQPCQTFKMLHIVI